MSHNIFTKAFVEQRNAHYNPDGSQKVDANSESTPAENPRKKIAEDHCRPAIVGLSKIGKCYIKG